MKTILIIEDEPDIYENLHEALGELYQTWHAPTLKVAQHQLEKRAFDLILLDMELPDGNGMDFYQLLKNQHIDLPPIIFLTGLADTDNKVHAFALGASDYVVKPFDLRELRARVRAKLTHSSHSQD